MLEYATQAFNFGEKLIGADVDREVITKGWVALIRKATGEEPIVQRRADANYIVWKPGQARKMENYFWGLMRPQKKLPPVDRGPDPMFDMSKVKISFTPVIMPMLFKTVIPLLIVYGVTVWYATRRFSK